MSRLAKVAALVALLAAGAAVAQDQPASDQAAPAGAVEGGPPSLQAQMQVELDRYRAAYEQEAARSRELEADRDRWKATVEQASRQVAACKGRNDQLFAVANEILDRFKRVDLDDVLGAKEPFTGLKRVQLENLAEGYADKIYAGRFDTRRDRGLPPPPPPAAESAPPTAPPPAVPGGQS